MREKEREKQRQKQRQKQRERDRQTQNVSLLTNVFRRNEACSAHGLRNDGELRRKAMCERQDAIGEKN